MSQNGWIGVDLDGTLAVYEGWQGAHNIGAPIAPMVTRVKTWIALGQRVRIMTARVYSDGSPERNADVETSRERIAEWCLEHLGFSLPATCTKDYGMIELWDDRSVQIVPNTGLSLLEINAKLRADNKALLEIVEFVEWRGHNQVCPVCHGSKYKGHGAMCNIGKALAEHSEPQ